MDIALPTAVVLREYIVLQLYLDGIKMSWLVAMNAPVQILDLIICILNKRSGQETHDSSMSSYL